MFAWIWSCMVLAFKASLGTFFWGIAITGFFLIVGLFFQMPYDEWWWKIRKAFREKEKNEK